MLVRLFMRFECLKTIFADGSYSGRLINWALSLLGWNMQVIERCQQRIFRVLPERWIVRMACIRRMVRLLGSLWARFSETRWARAGS